LALLPRDTPNLARPPYFDLAENNCGNAPRALKNPIIMLCEKCRNGVPVTDEAGLLSPIKF
jgi:hypothetical protein